MASDLRDTAFGFIMFILFLALSGYAAGGIGSPSSTAGTTGGTSQSLPPLAGSEVSSRHAARAPRTGRTRYGTSPPRSQPQGLGGPHDPGQKCATATPGARTTKVTLAYTADKTQMDSCALVIQRLLSR